MRFIARKAKLKDLAAIQDLSSLWPIGWLGAELENMFVAPGFRSKGVGSALVKEFINWCKKRNVRSVEVWAQYKNERGKKFYESNGFLPARQMFERKLK